MKKSLTPLSVAAAALLASGAVFAQSAYVGASVGSAYWSDNCSGLTSCSKNDTSYKIFGGYNFTPNFAVEGGYTDLGKITGNNGAGNVSVTANGVELAAVGKAPVGSGFGLFGKLGLSMMQAKNSGFNGAFDNTTSTQLLAGVGATYAINSQVALRAEYETRQVKFSGTKDTVGNFTVGIQASF